MLSHQMATSDLVVCSESWSVWNKTKKKNHDSQFIHSCAALVCNWSLHVFQVDEAVAVLQAHQAKEAAQKSVTSTAVPAV